MSKEQMILTLKTMFMEPNYSAIKMKKIKELYKVVKALSINDKAMVPKDILDRYNAL